MDVMVARCILVLLREPLMLNPADPPEYDEANLTSEERNYRAAVARWYADEGAYEHQQMTRPATLSYGLSDSPVGLLAWLLEKYHAWYGAFSDDEILTQASLYWHTGTIATSFRPYWEFGRGRAERVRWVEAPTAIAVFPNDLSQPPRSWAQRTYNVVRYTPDATRRPLRTPFKRPNYSRPT